MAGVCVSSDTSTSVAESAKNILRESYKCRIIENVGDFAFVVSTNLTDDESGPRIKFQLPGNYPAEDCTIRLIIDGLSEETRDEMEQKLLQMAAELDDHTELSRIVEAARQQYDSVAESLCSTDSKTKQKPKQKKQKDKKKREETSPTERKTTGGKKPPMKTAEDVIKRILWDSDFTKENFIIGYVDRFTGIEEKPFTAFSWEDLASVDYYTLAIPQHRIEYFKYRNVKVWDKAQRLDLVFGSTGSPATVLDVIRTCDEGAVSAAANLSATPAAHPADLGEGSDDELELELGAMTRLRMGATPVNDRPNYFLCLRVTDEAVVQRARDVQQHILRLEPRYADCVIPEVCLHVTVACIGLDDADDVRRCCAALEAKTGDIRNALPAAGLEFTLNGVSNFRNSVVYAKVEQNVELIAFVQNVCSALEDAKISIRNQFSYVPHMTLMKVSRPVAREMRSKFVDPCLYNAQIGTFFGRQGITEMHLCSMEALRESNGFYLSPYCVPLSS